MSGATAILGTGREGCSLAWLLTERHLGQSIDVWSMAASEPQRELPEAAEFHLGEPSLQQLQSAQVIYKSPGISPYRGLMARAVALRLPVSSATQWWFDHNADAQTVVVTGTKGKSTTASLIAHLLRKAGQPVELLGNIGRPLTDVPHAAPETIHVIELSSYQTWQLRAQPTLAVVTNLYPEHLDWHGSWERYRRDKLGWLRDIESPVVTWAQDPAVSGYLTHQSTLRFGHTAGWHVTKCKSLARGDSVILHASELPLVGAHNMRNLAAAMTALDILGIEIGDLADAVASFTPLPHRLQNLGTSQAGITFVNDSIATTPHATVAALSCFPPEQTLLIIGGQDRGLDWQPFLDYCQQHGSPKAILAMGELGQRVAPTLEPLPCESEQVNSLEMAMQRALDLASGGDTLLLSPGAPSYGMFRDFEHRGQVFEQLALAERP